MPIDYSNYPPDWKTRIRPAILERAGNKCEFCGAPNRTTIWRDTLGNGGPPVWHMGDCAESAELYCADTGQFVGFSYQCSDNDGRAVKVVLTIAHLDHDTTNNDYCNLKALCQRCHLKYDAEHHAKNRAATLAKKKGLQNLFDE